MQNELDISVETLFAAEREKSIYKIKLKGSFIYNNSHKFTFLLTDLIHTNINKIILDFSELNRIDSSGIGILIYYAKKGKKENYEYVIIGSNEFTENVLKMLNFNKIVKIFPSLNDGIKYFS